MLKKYLVNGLFVLVIFLLIVGGRVFFYRKIITLLQKDISVKRTGSLLSENMIQRCIFIHPGRLI